MSWNTSAYTELGSAMLTEAMSGRRMTFTRAVGGAGILPADDLPTATSVTDQRQTLILADSTAGKDGDDSTYKLKVQISNKGVAKSYTLHQIGIYAKLEDSSSDALVCIFQDSHGFEIQTEEVMTNFLLEFYGLIVVSGTAQITVTADPAAIATENWVRELLAEHDKDPEAHKELFAAITAENISFDGPAAGLEADNVQAAVKEMSDKMDGLKDSLTAKNIKIEDTMGTGADNLQEALDNVLSNTLPKLTITAAAGSALTLTDGKSTLTGVVDSGGSYTVTLPRMGLWTVAATLAGLTTDDTISIETVGGAYSLDLPYFAATLAVTAVPGATVTATLPTGKEYTATAGDDGTAKVKIKRSGTYTVAAAKGDAKSDTATVDVTESGSTYTATLHFCRLVLTAPTGSTVTAMNGEHTVSGTVPESGSLTLYLPAAGAWAVTATLDDQTTESTVEVTEYKDYPIELAYVKIYGVCWNCGATPTPCTRLTKANDPNGFVNVDITTEPKAAVGTGAGSSPFDACAPWSGMEEYNIVSGKVGPKFGENGFSRSNNGDVMVFIPGFWYKIVDDASSKKRYYYIADKQKAGWDKHPGSGRYVGRYHTNTSNQSRTGYSPYVSVTRATARSGAKGKGTGWALYDYATWSAVGLLYLVEYADWGSQAKVGRGYCDSNSSALSAGGTDSMVYHTGRAAGTDGKTAVQYRHIENPWGNVFQWIDGINFNGSTVYACTDPSKYADDTSTGYTNVGVRATSNGYISALGMSTTAPWAIYPTATGGSETTYVPDYSWQSTGWLGLYVGGYWSSGSNAGLFCFDGYCGSSGSYSNLGARLLFVP